MSGRKMEVVQAGMIETVEATLKRYHMLPRGSRVGVAVSGGADSVCLLHVLEELSGREGWRLEVLHLNHGLRGEESDGDERFVIGLAERLGLKSHVGREAVRARGGNLEEAARNARREFFARMRGAAGLDRIATGHTLDDQAETVLFRALRGAGSGGLQGILPVTKEGVVRPLVGVERAEVRQWLTARELDWREDSTNGDRSLARNRLRLELLPALEETVNAGGRRALARLAALVQDEERAWEETVGERARGLFIRRQGAVVMRASELAEAGPALARRLVRRAIGEQAGGLRRVEFEHVESILELAGRRRGEGAVQLPGAVAERSFDWLRIGAARVEAPGPVKIEGAGEWQIGDWRVRIEGIGEGGGVLRGWRAGDRLRMSGSSESVSLKDFFQKSRIPRWERAGWPVIEKCGNELEWAARRGLAEGAGEKGWIVTAGTNGEGFLPI